MCTQKVTGIARQNEAAIIPQTSTKPNEIVTNDMNTNFTASNPTSIGKKEVAGKGCDETKGNGLAVPEVDVTATGIGGTSTTQKCHDNNICGPQDSGLNLAVENPIIVPPPPRKIQSPILWLKWPKWWFLHHRLILWMKLRKWWLFHHPPIP